MIGNVGGVQNVLILIAGLIVSKYSNIGFKISSINFLYKVKTKDENLDVQDHKLEISFFDRLKLITNICPNLKMKRFIK